MVLAVIIIHSLITYLFQISTSFQQGVKKERKEEQMRESWRYSNKNFKNVLLGEICRNIYGTMPITSIIHTLRLLKTNSTIWILKKQKALMTN